MMPVWNGEPYPGFFKEQEEAARNMEHGLPADAILRWNDDGGFFASWNEDYQLKTEDSDVKKIIPVPEADRSKYLHDVLGDMDMNDLDFVDFYEVVDDPETLEIRVRGRLKRDIGTTKKDTAGDSSDDAWERAKGVI